MIHTGSMIPTCFLVEQFVSTPAAFETLLKTIERFVACIIVVLFLSIRYTPWHTTALLNSQIFAIQSVLYFVYKSVL